MSAQSNDSVQITDTTGTRSVPSGYSVQTNQGRLEVYAWNFNCSACSEPVIDEYGVLIQNTNRVYHESCFDGMDETNKAEVSSMGQVSRLHMRPECTPQCSLGSFEQDQAFLRGPESGSAYHLLDLNGREASACT